MRFTVITFGCQMNVLDSDWLSRALTARGWKEVPEKDADVVVLNTCSVREKPEQKVYSCLGRLARAKTDNPDFFAAVGGCVAQQLGEAFLERFPFVRAVFGTDGLPRVPAALEEIAAGEREPVLLTEFLPGYEEREPVLPRGWKGCPAPGQGFVNIMQGCDNFCTYCIVPYVRGRQKSRVSEAVLAECRELAGRGVRDLTLLGQNVNSYGLDRSGAEDDFPKLLRRVAKIPGIERLRFTTSHPKDIAGEVVAAFAEVGNLCPHLHLPAQCGSDRVLRRMGRGYTGEQYLDIVRALKRARPDIALSTDLIVGFPGETEEDFQATLDLMREADFESSFSFCYSDRPGTAAMRMEPKVDQETARNRLSRLQSLQDGLTRKHLSNQVGGVTSVLVEGRSRRQEPEGPVHWRGRDPGNRVVNLPLDPGVDPVGRFFPVRIVEAKHHSLIGEKAGEPW